MEADDCFDDLLTGTAGRMYKQAFGLKCNFPTKTESLEKKKSVLHKAKY